MNLQYIILCETITGFYTGFFGKGGGGGGGGFWGECEQFVCEARLPRGVWGHAPCLFFWCPEIDSGAWVWAA